MKIATPRPASGAVCIALFVALAALAGSAQAQWAWRDAQGKITYSDAPPPADVQPASILRQPEAPSPETAKGDKSAPPASYSTPETAVHG